MKNKKTFKESFGKNPWDPWSAKAGLDETSEAQLQKYLLARGINPQYVSKDAKIAHSKSNQFKQWAATHRVEEVGVDEQMTPTHVRLHDLKKKLHTKSHEIKTPPGPGSHNEDVKEPTGELKKACWKGYTAVGMKDKGGKKVPNCVPEETELEEGIQQTLRKVVPGYAKKQINQKMDRAKFGKTDADKDANYYRYKKVLDKTTKEETELDEGSVQDKLHTQHQAIRKKSGLPHPDYYKELSKSYDISDDSERHAKQSEIKKKYNVNESLMHDDPKGTMTRVAERKKEMSRSARIIKSIYKKKGVKEDTYDWEKDDKSTASYGKKPKLSKAEDKTVSDKRQPDAAAILSGGKTLTSQDRDIIELDPRLRQRSNKDAQNADDSHKN